MTRVRRINLSQIEGDGANNNTSNEIRPYGEIGIYVGDNNKLELLMFDGVRTNVRSKVLNKGTFYGGDADSGDGLNRDTIKLIPDTQLFYNNENYGNDQYIIIDPTIGEPGHIHIRAGGAIDQSTADLFLGGENNNVRVSDTYDRVTISTDAGEGLYTWTFGTDGGLTFPDSTVQTTAYTGGGGTGDGLSSNDDINITVDSGDSSSYTWNFGQTGDLTLPGGLVFDRNNTSIRVGMGFHIASGEGVSIEAIDQTDPDNLIYKNWNFGTDGILTFPDSDLTIGNQLGGPTIVSAPGTSLQIVSSGAESSAAMAWVDDIEAATKIAGVVANNLLYVGDGDVGIVTGDSLNVEGGTVNIWNFNADGTLTVPGNITKTSGNLEITAENYVIIDSTNGGQIDIGANQSGEGSGVSGPILVGHAGNILDIAAGKIRVNATPPTNSTGAFGDVAGLVAFDNSYIYYCTADYGQVGHQVTVATLYNGGTSINSNMLQLTKTADTLQITVNDIISDSDGGATSVVGTVSHDDNYTYVGTGPGGGVAYNCIFPLTFTSTDYVAGGNIWKRVAWSGDTW